MAENAHPQQSYQAPEPESEQVPVPEADVRESFKGRIKSDPQLSTTKKGHAKFYAKVEQRHWHPEPDGTYTRLPNSYHDLVAYKGPAVRAYKELQKNDYFIAEGRMEGYLSKRTGEIKQRFVATAAGHDMAYTRYEVDRTPRREASEHDAVAHEAPQQDAADRETPAFAAPEQHQDRQPPAMGL